MASSIPTPGPEIMRRSGKGSERGSQRVASENFNRAHAPWEGKRNGPKDVALSAVRCTAIRKKIRRALYDQTGEFIFEKGELTYRDAVSRCGNKSHILHKNIDLAFAPLQLAEDCWTADYFTQDVFREDRNCTPATPDWVHPSMRNSSRQAAIRDALTSSAEPAPPPDICETPSPRPRHDSSFLRRRPESPSSHLR